MYFPSAQVAPGRQQPRPLRQSGGQKSRQCGRPAVCQGRSSKMSIDMTNWPSFIMFVFAGCKNWCLKLQSLIQKKLLSWLKNLVRSNYYPVSRILQGKIIILADPTVMQEKYYSIGKLKSGFQLYQAPCSPQWDFLRQMFSLNILQWELLQKLWPFDDKIDLYIWSVR